ncbi:3-isopropylmalate dehydratase small subunit [Paraburkholderia rhynchosiae]|uniref:3-isopropylmalate dehydratase small subunit n=1 Tax=Paraburkholderia rhynchosiae TaxID=487049 RepID=A0A2N7VV92_9BURK|nr:3-isopropylmalate dehydratase small subunit [Paraburkholderia rhynchosiae]PMS21076.1 3-isopropylmalate dehydratase small subunit [Paraburkholderia rhynchosiae]CAB3742163.1 3-isopropylmalate dehydratase small subunit [Paraburkholderia rhynchosiae]
MSTLTHIAGSVLPLPVENLDTDQIMPKQFLRIVDKAGLADGLLYDLRHDGEGKPRPDSILNDRRYREAKVLVGGANFGCGSSREHAVWGLQQYGFVAVIAPSFAEIFYSNAMNNRLLLVQLPRAVVDALVVRALADPATLVSIDLDTLTVGLPDGEPCPFPLGARHRAMVMQGIDTTDLTLQDEAGIEAFERRHFVDSPWAAVF